MRGRLLLKLIFCLFVDPDRAVQEIYVHIKSLAKQRADTDCSIAAVICSLLAMAFVEDRSKKSAKFFD